MSAEDYKHEMLVSFLRQSTIEGLLNPAVAKSRLNAVENLFIELTEEEKEDLRRAKIIRNRYRDKSKLKYEDKKIPVIWEKKLGQGKVIYCNTDIFLYRFYRGWFVSLFKILSEKR